jgi:uncharacterized membrane protein
VLVWGLYLAGFVSVVLPQFGVAPFAGVIIAYMKRGDLTGSPFESHMTSAIYTFWVFCFGFVVANAARYSPPSTASTIVDVVAVGILVWTVLRATRGLRRALAGKPIDNPTGWL